MSNFKATFIKRLSQKKWNDFELGIRTLVKEAVAEYKGNNRHIYDEGKVILPNVNDDDYSQAFGLLQGVAYYALGYNSLGCDNVEGTPKNWLCNLEQEIGKLAYQTYLHNLTQQPEAV